MQKITTQLIKTDNDVSKTKGPRLSTINFLKQFARVYSCPIIVAAPQLSGFVAN